MTKRMEERMDRMLNVSVSIVSVHSVDKLFFAVAISLRSVCLVVEQKKLFVTCVGIWALIGCELPAFLRNIFSDERC